MLAYDIRPFFTTSLQNRLIPNSYEMGLFLYSNKNRVIFYETNISPFCKSSKYPHFIIIDPFMTRFTHVEILEQGVILKFQHKPAKNAFFDEINISPFCNISL